MNELGEIVRRVGKRGREAALRAIAGVSVADPLACALHRTSARLGSPRDPKPLLEHYDSRAIGGPRSEMRYRFELSHRRGVPMPIYARDPAAWVAFRESEQSRVDQDPFAFEARLLAPVLIAEACELFAELGEGDERARRFVSEMLPVARRDFAAYVQALEPFEDTFALYRLVRATRTLERLHPIAVALATTYAGGTRGPVEGARFPFHGRPLCSASAQLASALVTLGSDLDLVAELTAFVASSARPSGGYGDADDRPDPLTTWVAVDLLARVDPSFDPTPAARFLERAQGEDGLFRALGPDAPWLTGEIVLLLEALGGSFAERFVWPRDTALDQKTGLPFYAYFLEVAELFAAMPGLASAEVEVAFIDLIGFRAFNNRCGQDAGDAVLREFGQALQTLPHARVVRDGGDEFMVLGAPGRTNLFEDLDALRSAWPARFEARFGQSVPKVAARALVSRNAGRDLRAAREQLGRGITTLKEAPNVSETLGLLLRA